MKVYKFQLKPNNTQVKKLNESFKLCRDMYNMLLYELNEQSVIDRNMIQGLISNIKICEPRFKKVYSKTLQYECYRLFSNLKGLSKLKQNGNKVGRLRFKGKNWFKTICYNQTGYKLIKTNNHYNKLCLSKIGDINLLQHRALEGNIKGVIIKRKVNTWEAHIITDAPYSIKKGTQEIGIDMGVMSFLHTSNNEVVKNPLFMNSELIKIKQIHKQISKTKKGSHNRYKKCQQLQLVWENIDNKKKDFFHKLTTKIVNTSKFISVEKLDIKSMTKNKKNKPYNHRNILDSSWGMFLQMLKFKAESAGIKYVEVSPYNTSKKCCLCGNIKNMPTNIRTYSCKCGNIIDRDYNASINILVKGKGFTFVGDNWLQLLMNQEATSLTV